VVLLRDWLEKLADRIQPKVSDADIDAALAEWIAASPGSDVSVDHELVEHIGELQLREFPNVYLNMCRCSNHVVDSACSCEDTAVRAACCFA
jgi:hypothetical protein